MEGTGIHHCELCNKNYQSKDTYKAHYRYGNCFSILEGEVEQESESDSEKATNQPVDDAEDDEEEEEEEDSD